MVKRCAYGGCKSDSRYPKSLAGGVIFFPFPKPNTQREQCLQWIKQCGRPRSQLNVKKINKSSYVCSKHFVNGQLTPDYPNPVLAVQVPNQSREQLGGCRKPPNTRLNLKKMEIESSAQDCEQNDLQQRSTQSDSKDASVSQGAGLITAAEEPEPQIFFTAEVKRRTLSSGTQCPYCRYRCGSRFSFQIHIGSQHPLHCEDVSVGRLGKVVFYQPTAKLFHCHICFFTSKDYAVVFEHLLARHCFSARKAVQTDKGKEVTNKLDTEFRHKEGREQSKSPNPGIKPDDENTTDHHRLETSNEDSLKRKRDSVSSGEDEDGDVSDSIQAANDEQVAAVEQYSEHSSAPYYDCKFCKLRCASKTLLMCHVSLKHDVPKPHACKECSETFMLESLLTSHISLHHRKELYQCPYCLFESSLQGLHQHLSQCKAVEGNEDNDVGTEEKK